MVVYADKIHNYFFVIFSPNIFYFIFISILLFLLNKIILT